MAQCQDKELSRENCNMYKAYYITNRYNLFDCKPASTIMLLPSQNELKKQKQLIFMLKSELMTLEYLVEQMKRKH